MYSMIASKEELIVRCTKIDNGSVHKNLIDSPPIILLKKRSYDDTLFNTGTESYDNPDMTISRYFSCGWTPIKIIEQKAGIKVVYIGVYMEFLGEKACRMDIKDYIWPKELIPCRNESCPHVTKSKRIKCYPLNEICQGTIMF